MTRSRNLLCIAVSLIVFILAFSPVLLRAQGEANIWYFGGNAGLDFNSGKPVALTDGAMVSRDGCATIADPFGRLRFYTDGITVWNRKHGVMPNGASLFGDVTATQSALIVPHPGDTNLFFIFTVDVQKGPNGFCYSVVDMRKGNGLGDVIQKNVKLFAPCIEKITSIHHHNQTDIWVIGHEAGSNVFRSYLVTASGVNSTPVTSAIGSVLGGASEGGEGQMAASPDGSRIAIVSGLLEIKAEVFDFDKSTGTLSNRINLPTYGYETGVCFSPDNSKLYISIFTLPAVLEQFDLAKGSESEIISSKVVLARPDRGEKFGSLQIGPDGKIYIARWEEGFVDVIEFPNEAGILCGYTAEAVKLKTGKSYRGLPAFIQSYFYKISFTYKDTCHGDITQFKLTNTAYIDSLVWNFGDTGSGNANTSTNPNPSHVFSKPDSFTVTMTYRFAGQRRSITKRILILPSPEVKLPKDTFLCDGASMLLDVSSFPAQKYKWSTGSTAKSITITERGKYWVELTNGPCKASDTIRIFGPPDVPGTLGPDRILCPGQTVELRTDIPAKAYLWSDGSTDTTLNVSQAGTYWVDMIMNCKTFRDSVVVFNTVPPVIDLGRDTQLCQGDTLVLDASLPYSKYLWQDSSSAAAFTVRQTGTYKVTVTNPCGQTSDSIRVTYLDPPRADLGRDTLLCLGDSIVWDLQQPYSTYLWQDGSTNSRMAARTSGTYAVEVTRACHTTKASVNLAFEDCTCYLYAPSAFSPNSDNMNDTFRISSCRTTDFLLQVYNRWGERVFESTDIKTGWDGKFNGQFVQDGLYLYVTRAKGRDNNWYYSKGQVNVLRWKE